MNRSTATLLTAALATGLATSASAAFDDFESFTPGQSINGQGQWTVQDSFGNSAELFDESIMDDGSGNQVWQVSNAYTSTSYSNQPFSSSPLLIAGETGAMLYNDYGTDHTMPNNPPLSSGTAASPYLYGSWDFRSATGAAQNDLRMDISAGGSQSTLRMSFVRITDTGTGFDLTFFDTTGNTFNGTTIATGLSYTDWHNLEMQVEFVDGIDPGDVGNDVVTISLNGSVIHTGTTWESYYFLNADTGPAGAPRAVDALLFRLSGDADAANAGAGFYIDNVDVSNVPEPGSIALLGLGGLALMSRRRRA